MFPLAGTQFFSLPELSVGKRLAIVISGQVYSAPKIQMEILGGSAQISGYFSEQEAKEFAS